MKVSLSKLHYSQEAHRKLRSKASADYGKDPLSAKKWTYHDRIYRLQAVKGRILSKAERRSIYKTS